MRKSLILVLTLCLILSFTACGQAPTTSTTATPTETTGGENKTISGEFPDGTKWAVLKPANWNGTLILDLDGANQALKADGESSLWMIGQGYAFGGITRDPIGYDFVAAVDYLVTVRQNFIDEYDQEPTRTIAMGGSRGAFVARLAMEFYPEIFDAAMVMAGGGAGQVAGLNAKLDAKFVLKTLVDPTSPLQLVNFTDKSAEEDALTALTELADSTPAGKARLALAAAIEQFPSWTSGTQPAADDYAAQYDQMVKTFVRSQFIAGTYAMEQLGGGVISWNNGIDYTEMLENSGRKDFVLGMYAAAGLTEADLAADLGKLAAAPRISADPAAVAKIEKFLTYTGEIEGPVMNLDNFGDQLDFQPLKLAYADTVRSAGNEDLLRICWVESAGHGSFTDLERTTAFVTLIDYLDNGTWGDTSASGMNARAAALVAEYPALQSASQFFEYEPAQPLRTWDYRNWDSYQP